MRAAKPTIAVLSLLLTLAVPALAAGTWHRGNGAEPETLDPHKSTGVPESHIQRDLFEGLVTEAADGQTIPGAAASWTISPDGLVYIFKLRPAGKWSDGSPVTAEDFVGSFRRIVDPATASKYAFMLWPVANGEAISKGENKDVASLGAKALDPLTLELTLARPTPYFLGLLAHHSAYPVPLKVIAQHGQQWTRPGNMVGNGAFKLDSWTPQDQLKLVKNPQFHDAANVSLDAVVYYPTEDAQAELKRYRAGELDTTYTQLLADQIAWAKKNAPEELKIAPYFGTYYYGLNLTKPPFKDDPDLRRALALAIDRQAIVDKITQAGELPSYGWVPPSTPNYPKVDYQAAKMTQAERDAEAKKLLAASKAAKAGPVEVEILYNTNDMHKRIAIAIASMWSEKLGIKTKLTNQEWKVYLASGDSKDFQAIRAGWIGDYIDAWTFLELLKSDAGKQNRPGYANPAYDALLAKASTTTDMVARGQIMAEAEAIMLADQPLVPIYTYTSKQMVKPYVKGWQTNVQDAHLSRWVSLTK